MEEIKGAFIESLKRNNKQIREDRAIAIVEDAELLYKRHIEDLETKVKRLTRDRDNMLDLSPTTSTSLTLASDFKSEEFIRKDMAIGVELRQLSIELEIAKERYKILFQ